jgi:hypothetical protein
MSTKDMATWLCLSRLGARAPGAALPRRRPPVRPPCSAARGPSHGPPLWVTALVPPERSGSRFPRPAERGEGPRTVLLFGSQPSFLPSAVGPGSRAPRSGERARVRGFVGACLGALTVDWRPSPCPSPASGRGNATRYGLAQRGLSARVARLTLPLSRKRERERYKVRPRSGRPQCARCAPHPTPLPHAGEGICMVRARPARSGTSPRSQALRVEPRDCRRDALALVRSQLREDR